MKKEESAIQSETTDEAIARGVTVQRFEEGKVSKREIKKRQKQEVEEGEEVDVKLLMSRCSPEQKVKLQKILDQEGIEIEEEQ